MPRNLLQEAIADAKTVRDMAIENARAQLEEAFKPHLATMLSNRLLSEDNDGTSGIGTGITVKEPAAKQPSATASKTSNIVNPGLEIEDDNDNDATALKEGDEFGMDDMGEDDFGMDDMGGGADQFGGTAPAAPAAPIAPAAPQQGMEAPELGAVPGGESEVDELDLDAIIRELELDLDAPDASTDPAMAPSTQPQIESFSDPNAGARTRGAFDGPLKEDAEGVHTDGKSPTAVDGVNGGKTVQPGQAVTGTKAETMTESEEIDLDEILREMEVEDANTNIATITSENKELKNSLREHRDVIKKLRDKINEVSMLNSKLLYTTKLFKGFDLQLEQKIRIVETFDRATTPREVKLVYATLAESLKTGLRGSKKNAKVVTEGFASKTVASTAPKTSTVIPEGDDLRARFQKLARINVK